MVSLIFRQIINNEQINNKQIIINKSMKVFSSIFSRFSSQKHFLDSKYQNISLEVKKKTTGLSEITKILSEQNAKITFIKSYNQLTVKDTDIYKISTQTLSKDKIESLRTKFNSIGVKFTQDPPIIVPWFPININDLNKIGHVDLVNEPLEDHLVYNDYGYKKRRDDISEIANNYKMGQIIPQVTFEEGEHALWREVYARLRELHKERMCQWYNKELDNMEKQLKLNQGIPKINAASQYMFKKTGFKIMPIHSNIGARQFFNPYAFKVFPCAQYFRHQKTPINDNYIDILHEILGHFVLFSHPELAKLVQIYGVLSLGATDEQLKEIATLFWYTIQYGFLKENGKYRSYGGGPAACIIDLEHCHKKQAKFKNLDVFLDRNTSEIKVNPQQIYYVTQSISEVLKEINQYAKSITKLIETSYNPQTEEIEYNRNWQSSIQCGIKDHKR